MAYPYRRRRFSKRKYHARLMAIPVLRAPTATKLLRITDYAETSLSAKAADANFDVSYICLNSPFQGIRASPGNINSDSQQNPLGHGVFSGEYTLGCVLECRVRIWVDSDQAEVVDAGIDLDDRRVVQTTVFPRPSMLTALATPAGWQTLRLFSSSQTKFLTPSYQNRVRLYMDRWVTIKDHLMCDPTQETAFWFTGTIPPLNANQLYMRIATGCGSPGGSLDICPAGRAYIATDWFVKARGPNTDDVFV